MTWNTLISADDLARLLDEQPGTVRPVDCRFDLGDPDAGHRWYTEGHVPGAVYAHLDDDLAGPVVPGRTGRHPLPDPERLADTLGSWGIDRDVQVVAYDQGGGAIAARLWWLLRWLGHEACAVLDGGWPAWTDAGHPVSDQVPDVEPRTFEPRPRSKLVAEVTEVAGAGLPLLVDSRGAARYRGEEEPIDPVAGHIPGALNRPFADNLEDGRFKAPERLRRELEELIVEAGKGRPEAETGTPRCPVFYCGSGVTAAHNLLAMAHAGLGDGRLYPGSWSEWITDPARPVATGDESG